MLRAAKLSANARVTQIADKHGELLRRTAPACIAERVEEWQYALDRVRKENPVRQVLPQGGPIDPNTLKARSAEFSNAAGTRAVVTALVAAMDRGRELYLEVVDEKDALAKLDVLSATIPWDQLERFAA